MFALRGREAEPQEEAAITFIGGALCALPKAFSLSCTYDGIMTIERMKNNWRFIRLSPDWFIRDFAVGRFDCLRLVSAMGKPTMPNAMPNDQSPHPSPQSPMPSAQGQCPMPSAQHPISNPQAPIPFPRKNGTEQKIQTNTCFIFPVWGNEQSWKMIRHALQQLWKSQRRKAGDRCSNVGAAVSGGPLALGMHALLEGRQRPKRRPSLQPYRPGK